MFDFKMDSPVEDIAQATTRITEAMKDMVVVACKLPEDKWQFDSEYKFKMSYSPEESANITTEFMEEHPEGEIFIFKPAIELTVTTSISQAFFNKLNAQILEGLSVIKSAYSEIKPLLDSKE